MSVVEERTVGTRQDVNQPLTEREAATRLGLKVATLRAWRHRKVGPAYVRLGRAVRYMSNDLDRYVVVNRHTPTAISQE